MSDDTEKLWIELDVKARSVALAIKNVEELKKKVQAVGSTSKDLDKLERASIGLERGQLAATKQAARLTRELEKQRVAALRVAAASGQAAAQDRLAALNSREKVQKSSRDKFLGRLGGVSREAIVAGGAGLAVGAATVAVREFTDAMGKLDDIAKKSKKSGLGAEEFQRLAYQAKISGTDIDVVSRGVRRMNTELRNVSLGGGKEFDGALKDIGLEAKKLEGLTAEQKIHQIADALRHVKDQGEASAIAARLFGEESGPHMLPMLNEGSEGLNKIAEQLSGVFTAEQLQRAEDFQDQMTKTSEAFDHAFNDVFLDVAPAVTQWLKDFLDLANELRSTFAGIGGAIGDLEGRLQKTAGGRRPIDAITDFFGLERVKAKNAIEIAAGLDRTSLLEDGTTIEQLETRKANKAAAKKKREAEKYDALLRVASGPDGPAREAAIGELARREAADLKILERKALHSGEAAAAEALRNTPKNRGGGSRKPKTKEFHLTSFEQLLQTTLGPGATVGEIKGVHKNKLREDQIRPESIVNISNYNLGGIQQTFEERAGSAEEQQRAAMKAAAEVFDAKVRSAGQRTRVNQAV